MSTDLTYPTRRVPSLTWYCQRVAITHLDSVVSVDSLPYELIKPILEACSPDHLARLEQASPNIETDTAEIWKNQCENTYKQFWAEYQDGKYEEPESWKDQFFNLRIQEAKRFEMLGAKLRHQRVEHEERKKEREIKITDRVPPSKKQRTWGQPQTKTLFEKARSRTAQMQKGVYAYNRMLPPMPPIKNYSAKPSPVSSRVPYSAWSSGSSSTTSSSTSPPPGGTRVTVNTVFVRKPPIPVQRQSPDRTPPPSKKLVPPPAKQQSVPKVRDDHPPPQVLPPPPGSKKDPMASLFMPKSRAFSQLPLSSRSTAR